ncbi:hypothetical protein BGX24_002155 [Mortierella sp. AD032]|nr:hypothetical protein BGX24_002155 [Mortierella sp. AD032]
MSKYDDGYDDTDTYELNQMQDRASGSHHGGLMDTAQTGLKRDLRLRHMIMIAIAGTIGTGLFLTSGSTIATAGPGGALLAYTLIGIWIVFVLQAIGEIATLLPLPGAFNSWGGRVFDEAFSFMMTWMYCINWALTIPAQLSASALIVSFWLPDDTKFPPWIVPLVIIVLMVIINIAGVKTYGELEYWFSILKVVTIIIFLVCGILVDAGALGGHTYGFENWKITGAPFKGGFVSFIRTLISVGYAYGGAEMIGITAAESRNPHKHVPWAINTVLIRIAFFYIASIFLLGCIVANGDPLLVNTDRSAARAPFTIVFAKAGISGAANYMNAWFVSIIGSISFQGWMYILILHFRFRYCWKVQGRDVNDLPYVAWGFPYGNIIGAFIGGCCIVCNWYLSIVNPPQHPGEGASTEMMNAYHNRRDAYIQGILGAWFPWFMSAILYFSYKFICGTKLIKAVDADLDTGRFIPSDSDKEDLRPHGPRWKRFLKMFV